MVKNGKPTYPGDTE